MSRFWQDEDGQAVSADTVFDETARSGKETRADVVVLMIKCNFIKNREQYYCDRFTLLKYICWGKKGRGG